MCESCDRLYDRIQEMNARYEVTRGRISGIATGLNVLNGELEGKVPLDVVTKLSHLEARLDAIPTTLEYGPLCEEPKAGWQTNEQSARAVGGS